MKNRRYGESERNFAALNVDYEEEMEKAYFCPCKAQNGYKR
jgi:hypothetical protein